MKMNLPEHVNQIIHRLQKEGYDAYAVGGCVRDTLLGRTPQDWDITTSAHPEIVKSLFCHTIDTGIQHGTVTVMLDHVGYEVTHTGLMESMRTAAIRRKSFSPGIWSRI